MAKTHIPGKKTEVGKENKVDKWVIAKRLKTEGDVPDYVIWKNPKGTAFHIDSEVAGEKENIAGFFYTQEGKSHPTEKAAKDALGVIGLQVKENADNAAAEAAAEAQKAIDDAKAEESAKILVA